MGGAAYFVRSLADLLSQTLVVLGPNASKVAQSVVGGAQTILAQRLHWNRRTGAKGDYLVSNEN